MTACEGLFFSVNVQSTIDLLVEPPRDPFFVLVSSVAKFESADFAMEIRGRKLEQLNPSFLFFPKSYYCSIERRHVSTAIELR